MNIPEGWKLVPIRATDEMHDAGVQAIADSTSGFVDEVYDAMLAAAPTPPDHFRDFADMVGYDTTPAQEVHIDGAGDVFYGHIPTLDKMRELLNTPAQEVAPVAWINRTQSPYAPMDMHVTFFNPGDDKWTPVYPHPQSDKLRKAASWVQDAMMWAAGNDNDISSNLAKSYAEILRKALEENDQTPR